MFALDWKVFQLLNGLAGRSHLLDTIVRLLVNEYVITTGLALVLMFLWFGAPNATVRAHNQRTVLYAAMTMVIANLLVKSMNLAIYRYRPFAENNVHLLFYRPSDSSFPSNAATVGFSLADADDEIAGVGTHLLGRRLYETMAYWETAEQEETLDAFDGLVREGKVRYTGVSNFSVGQMQRIQPIHPIASLQAPYSLVARGIETELLPFCAANNIGIIAYSPMHNGLLTGKVTREWVAALPADDWRRDHNPEFREPALSANLSLLDGLRPIAQGHGKSPGEVAIAWVLRRPEVTTAIVGARSPGQIEGTIGGGDLQLSDADIAKIDGLLAARARALATA